MSAGIGAGLAVVGSGLSLAGGFMNAGATGTRQQRLFDIAANFKPIDIDQSMSDTVAGNAAIFPAAKGLASSVNTFNRDELLKSLRATIPGYDQIVGGQSALVSSQLKGEVPKDVQNQIARYSSERGINLGTGTSAFSRNLEARDLGLTSLNLMNQGFANAGNFLTQQRNIATPAMFDVSTMFMTPAQRIGIQQQERNTGIALWQQAIGAPMSDEIIAGTLSSIGGSMMGLGGSMATASMMQPAQSAPAPSRAPSGTSFDSGGRAYSPNAVAPGQYWLK